MLVLVDLVQRNQHGDFDTSSLVIFRNDHEMRQNFFLFHACATKEHVSKYPSNFPPSSLFPPFHTEVSCVAHAQSGPMMDMKDRNDTSSRTRQGT